VIELFTSEGCSSCPPAEAIFERIAEGARAAGQPVIPLAFHVDYWDELGWPDRFASPLFTARQGEYARAFGDGNLYTPEMVVGGVDHFVGSNAARAAASLRDALARPAVVPVTLAVTRSTPESITVRYELPNGAPDRATLRFAIAQRAATVHVERGENAGRTLHHANIVRSFSEAALPEGTRRGDAVVHLPWAPAPLEADAVVLVERTSGPDAMAVLGGATAVIPP
jgi:hypothetical protein